MDTDELRQRRETLMLLIQVLEQAIRTNDKTIANMRRTLPVVKDDKRPAAEEHVKNMDASKEKLVEELKKAKLELDRTNLDIARNDPKERLRHPGALSEEQLNFIHKSLKELHDTDEETKKLIQALHTSFADTYESVSAKYTDKRIEKELQQVKGHLVKVATLLEYLKQWTDPVYGQDKEGRVKECVAMIDHLRNGKEGDFHWGQVLVQLIASILTAYKVLFRLEASKEQKTELQTLIKDFNLAITEILKLLPDALKNDRAITDTLGTINELTKKLNDDRRVTPEGPQPLIRQFSETDERLLEGSTLGAINLNRRGDSLTVRGEEGSDPMRHPASPNASGSAGAAQPISARQPLVHEVTWATLQMLGRTKGIVEMGQLSPLALELLKNPMSSALRFGRIDVVNGNATLHPSGNQALRNAFSPPIIDPLINELATLLNESGKKFASHIITDINDARNYTDYIDASVDIAALISASRNLSPIDKHTAVAKANKDIVTLLYSHDIDIRDILNIVDPRAAAEYIAEETK